MKGHLSKRQPFALGPSKRLGLLHGSLAVDQVRPEPAARQIILIKIHRSLPSGKRTAKPAAFRHGLVLDQSDCGMSHDSADLAGSEAAALGPHRGHASAQEVRACVAMGPG